MTKKPSLNNAEESMEELDIAVRCHVEAVEDIPEDVGEPANRDETPIPVEEEGPFNYAPRILVIDTETTVDEYQNLLFGTAMLVVGDTAAHIDGFVKKKWLIYGEYTPTDKIPLMEEFAIAHRMELVDRLTFVKDVLFHELTFWKTPVVGFNLPFDLPRMAVAARTHQTGKQVEEIELIFDPDDKYLPTIGIQAIDGLRAFITLHCHTGKKPYNDRITLGRGKFLDLHTLTKVLTDESMTLKQAGEHFKAGIIKIDAEEHGDITREYLEYNYRDVEATIALYRAAVEAYWKHPVKRPPHKVYSPASLGKAYLDAFGIQPLLKHQPDFPRDILGYCMEAFYGGRAECQIRREIHPVCHVDFMSQYPSVYTLMNLQKYLIADRIEPVEATKDIQELLDRITLEDLFHKETWPGLMGIAALRPDGDRLPVRAEYQQGHGYQIGLNHVYSDELLWYAIPDLIASKLLTGRTPHIERAIRFQAVGVQDSIRPLKFMGRDDLEINPRKDQIFKKVIEARQAFKAMKKEDGDEFDIIQHQLKIFANATSYGINVEANRVDRGGEVSVRVFGGGGSWEEVRQDYDQPGKYYNPVVGAQITGAAHLLLAMAERLTLDLGGQPMMMDTDSLMIASLTDRSPFEIGKAVSERFRSLLPYDLPKKGKSLLEIEDDNWARKDWSKDYDSKKLPDGTVDDNLAKGQYEPLYCYMIAAKRYVLFNLVPGPDGRKEIIIRKKSDHGLGHMVSPDPKWITAIWKWIISREIGLPYQEPEWFRRPAFTQFKLARPHTYEMFNRGAEDKPWAGTIKPFNFGIRGFGPHSGMISVPTVHKYYCIRNHSIQTGYCKRHAKCHERTRCLANRTVIPIAPYAKKSEWKEWRSWRWIDAHTGNLLPVCLSSYTLDGWRPVWNPEGAGREPGADPAAFPFADYMAMFASYPLHPETKYNAGDGGPCQPETRGRLYPKHIRVKQVKRISKEANTIVSIDEEEMFPDDPAVTEGDVLSYGEGRKPAGRPVEERDNEPQWEDMRKKLKRFQKAGELDKDEIAKKLGITKRYFNLLLAGKRFPSYDVLQKLNDILYTRNRDKKILEKPVEKDGGIYRLRAVAAQCGWTVDEAREAMRDHLIRLNREWLVDTNRTEVREMIEGRREFVRQEAERKRLEFMANPTVNIHVWDRDIEGFRWEQIHLHEIERYRIKRVNTHVKRVQVRTKSGLIGTVADPANTGMLFKLGLLPRPGSIRVDWSKAHEGKYGPWLPYPQGLPFVHIGKIANHYGAAHKDILSDIESGKLQGKRSTRKKGEIILCDPWQAWKLYRRCKIEQEPQTGEA